jgi:hypothetical protein
VPPPVAVVFAETTQDVADAVALAAQYRVPVIPFRRRDLRLKGICSPCKAVSALT